MVDRSLVRAGRFDVKVPVMLPSLETKIEIFRKYLSKTEYKLEGTDIVKFVNNVQLSSGAEIEVIVNEAIYISMRRESSCVEAEDLVAAVKQHSH
jgi:ATP-dependent 26S proteasome regulatory subunit